MLGSLFEKAKRERRLAFIPYVMAGDPDLATTQAVIEALADAGADLVELGVPYSDPLADGPTVAAAGARALANGTSIGESLALARRCASAVPIVLFTYFNPIYRYGIERFAREAAAAGVAGAIVPDVALEETEVLRAQLQAQGLALPLLVAPSTPPQRAERIAAAASGFVYVVSRLGVTGAGQSPDFAPLRKQLSQLREITGKPLAVGFGLSRAQDVAAIGTGADAVVVGSALIDAYAQRRGAEAARMAREFVTPLLAACRLG